MDLLDRLLQHDAATTRQLLLLSQDLNDEALDRPFDIGHQTLRATFAHIIGNMEVWTTLMREEPVGTRATANTIPELIARLDTIAPTFAAIATHIRDTNRWDEQWLDTLDQPPQAKTFGGAIGHLITHSMYHRGEVQHILKRLGVANIPEGDLLSWEQSQRQQP